MKDYLGGFGGSDRYDIDNKWDKLQRDIAERMKDPFMINELIRNIKEAWRRYWQYRDEFDRNVTALTNINSGWSEYSISLNTEYTVYGDDARAVILRMRSGKITAREDFVKFALDVKNIISPVRSFLSAKSLEDFLEDLINITILLEDAIDQLVIDNARLIENMLFRVREAADNAEKFLEDYGGFKFQYNVSSLGFSIDISSQRSQEFPLREPLPLTMSLLLTTGLLLATLSSLLPALEALILHIRSSGGTVSGKLPQNRWVAVQNMKSWQGIMA